MTTIRARPARPSRRRPAAHPYINRELSWLDFNARVLHEARDERNPLLERAKFLAIFGSQPRRVLPGPRRRPDGAGRRREREALTGRAHRGRAAGRDPRPRPGAGPGACPALRPRCAPALAAEGVAIVDHAAIPEHHARLRERYLEEIFPVLTPLAVAPGHPFPYISTLSLSLAVVVRDPVTGSSASPASRCRRSCRASSRWTPSTYVPLEQVIAANLDALFPGMEIVEAPPLPGDPRRRLRRRGGRGRGPPVGDRAGAAPAALRLGRPPRGRGADARGDPRVPPRRDRPRRRTTATRSAGMLDLTCLWQLATWTARSCATRPGRPSSRRASSRADEDEAATSSPRSGRATCSSTTRTSRSPRSVERFIAQAADDPDVLAIKHDALPHVRRLADRARPDPGRRAGQAGGRPRRDQGPLRRGGEHRVGAQAGAGGRPRRLRPGGPQDPLQDRARRPPRGLAACAATSTSGPATTTRRPPASTRTSGC